MFRIPRGFPNAGRFTDALSYLLYVAEAQFIRDTAAKEVGALRKKLRRARRVDTLNRLTEALDNAERQVLLFGQGVEAESYQDRPMPPKSRAPKVRAGEVAVGRRNVEGQPEWAIVEPRTGHRMQGAATWEFGVTYDGRKGHQDVSFNARVSRHDGAYMTKAEAFRVFDYVAQGRGFDAQTYDVHAVSWQRPQWGVARTGAAQDLASFESIMTVAIAEGQYRLGAVDE